MKESNFIKQNKDKWKEFEGALNREHQDPDKLNELFIQITDDLSYSRTFYPNRSVRVYLNSLAQKIFINLYKGKKSHGKRIISFWTDELPKLITEARSEFRLAFFIFAVAVLIGIVSSAMDTEFPRVILGDRYVDMTLANIESGDPMAVYKESAPLGMTIGITLNNLLVAFITFIMGVFYAIGTVGMLIANGVMLGAFQYFFIEKGLFWESFLTIWIHGTLEISSIIIAGAAGLTMGKGLVFPGTLPRIRSFQISARRGLKIMLGITPLFIFAGFFEGYLTRHTEAPDILRFAFIAMSLLFVVGYFIWYPRYKAAKGFKNIFDDFKLQPNPENKIDFHKIKTQGEIFSEVFVFFSKHIRKILRTAAVLSLAYTAFTFFLSISSYSEVFYYPQQLFGIMTVLSQFFKNSTVPYLLLINGISIGVIAFTGFRLLAVESDVNFLPSGKNEKMKFHVLSFLKLLIGAFAIAATLYFSGWFTWLLIWFLFPYFLVWMYNMYYSKSGPFLAMTNACGREDLGSMVGLSFILLFIGMLFLMILNSTLIYFILHYIGMNLSFEQSVMDNIATVILTFTSMFLINIVFFIYFTGFGLLYYSSFEKRNASELKRKIESISLKRSIRGIEKERK